MLHRLMRRAVLTQSDGVVGPRVDHVEAAQRGKPDRRPHVVGEDEEGAPQRQHTAMRRHAVHHRAHAVLADPVVDLDPAGRLACLYLGALHLHPVVARQVRRSGQEAWKARRRGVDALVDCVPGRQLGASLEGGQVVGPAREPVAGLRGVPGRPVPLPGGKALGPGGPLLRPPRDGAAVEVAYLVGDPERLVRRQAQDLLGRSDLVLPERIPVRRRGVGEVGRRPADVAAQHEEGRLRAGPVGGLLEGLADGGLEAIDVIGHLAEVVHPPAVGLEALGHIVVVSQLGRPVDRDVVVVVEGEQPAQPEMPGQGGRLV